MPSFRVLLPVALAVSFLAGGGCRRETAGPQRPTPSVTMQSPSPTDAASPSPTPTPTGAASPELAARNLYDSWQMGDRTKAAQFATEEAVNVTFSRPFFALDFAGCDAEGSGFACSYETESEEMRMTLSGSSETGYTVETVAFLTA